MFPVCRAYLKVSVYHVMCECIVSLCLNISTTKFYLDAQPSFVYMTLVIKIVEVTVGH